MSAQASLLKSVALFAACKAARRWAVAANITQFHTDEAGNRYRGTKPFTAGTKVYLYGEAGGGSSGVTSVMGLNRFGRWAFERIPACCVENLRVKKVFKPKVLKLMYFDEAHEGMRWWKDTPQDRAEAQAFVQGWQGSKEQ